MKKKILITGSSGMLGSDLVRTLSSDADVFGISRNPRPDSSKQTFQLDLTNFSALSEILRQVKPDYVIHAAALTKVDLCEAPDMRDEARRQNVSVVESLAEVCNALKVPLLFFSTDYVFPGTKKEPYVEDDAIQPINFYGQTKAWAEQVLAEKSNRYMIFRVTWLFGENGNHFPRAILNQASRSNEIAVVNDQRGRPTWTRDVAQALHQLLFARQNLLDQYNKQIFHIGNEEATDWASYARFILDLAGFMNVRVKEITSAELKRPAPRPQNSVLDLSKARKLLGIQMRPWDEAVKAFLSLQG
jgi:dTDP-4-dehydrorhamnose reductase